MDGRNTIFELSHRYQLSMILHLVVDLDVGPRLLAGESIEDVAISCGVKAGGLRSATQALAAATGIFDATGGALTEVGAELLDPRSPRCVAPMIEHEARQQGLWHSLDGVLRASGPVAGQQDVEMALNERRLALLLRAMRSMNPELVGEVGALDAWTGRKTVLDVAGGHGAFLAQILSGDDGRSGAVLDQPTARGECEATLTAAGLTNRATFSVCDLNDADPLAPWTADAVLLCRCLHNFSPTTIDTILSSARSALSRSGGGVCIVIERHLDRVGPRLVPRESALFSAYMAVNCAGGHVPRTERMVAALERIGTVKEVELGELHTAFVCEVS